MERESRVWQVAKKAVKGAARAVGIVGYLTPSPTFEIRPAKADTVVLQKKTEATGPGGKPEIPEEVSGEKGNL